MRSTGRTLSSACEAAAIWLLSSFGSRIAVMTLLATQAGLLAYSATRHSPTFLEPAFLASGISHWQFGRFELYRVNPPLVRMVAALPVLAVGCETDWSRFYDGPGSRAEFPIGEDFIKANGPRSIPLFFYARWACIPFALIGGYFAYRWSKDLYGPAAALFTLWLWTFEPNLLAHAELITPDSACTSFGIAAGYWFYRWLKEPTWSHVGWAGLFLGLTQLSKMSWFMLFGLWPVMWAVWRWVEGRRSRVEGQAESTAFSDSQLSTLNSQPPALQLAVILGLALYILNLGYAFDGTLTQLKDFTFVSTSLTGLEKPGTPGNRFRDTILGELPLPVPKQFVLGFDSQKKDFEDFGQPSYLRGEWKEGGWWYYYLYGLLVKVPCGICGIAGLVALRRCFRNRRYTVGCEFCRGEYLIWLPAVCLLILVSSQLEFNHHLRYVFPSLGLGLVLLGQALAAPVGCAAPMQVKSETSFENPFSPRFFLARRLWLPTLSVSLLLYSTTSALLVYPHQLAYFNEFVGGPREGWRHLLGSSFNWGQQILLVHSVAHAHGHRIGAFHSSPADAMFYSLITPHIKEQRSVDDALAAIRSHFACHGPSIHLRVLSINSGGTAPDSTSPSLTVTCTCAERYVPSPGTRCQLVGYTHVLAPP